MKKLKRKKKKNPSDLGWFTIPVKTLPYKIFHKESSKCAKVRKGPKFLKQLKKKKLELFFPFVFADPHAHTHGWKALRVWPVRQAVRTEEHAEHTQACAYLLFTREGQAVPLYRVWGDVLLEAELGGK